MKLHVAQLVLAAAAMLATSTGSASSIPAECEADTNCSICVKVARTQLILTAMSTPQNCVLTGKWDEKIQACIDGDCSSTEAGCIEGLQTWINATSVDIDALNGETVGGGGIICNKAGSIEAVNVVKEDGVRCKVIDPPQSTLDGMKTMEIKDGVSGKVFDSNCVLQTQSLITAVCLSEEDCSEYGVPFKEQPDKDVNNSPKYSDDDEDDEEDDGFFDPSSANARVNVNGIGGMLTMAAVVYAYVWNL